MLEESKHDEAEEHFTASLKVRVHLHGRKAIPTSPTPDIIWVRSWCSGGGSSRRSRRSTKPCDCGRNCTPPRNIRWGIPSSPSLFSFGQWLRRGSEIATEPGPSRLRLAMFQRQAELFAAQSSEAEALNFIAELSVFRSDYLSACIEAKEPPDYGLVWSGKSVVYRVLMERQRTLPPTPRTIPRSGKLRRSGVMFARLAGRMLSQASLVDPEHSKVLADLTNEKEELERILNARSARTPLPAARAPDDLISGFPPQAALVDIFQYDRFLPTNPMDSKVPSYMAFVVRRGQRPTAVNLGDAKPIDEALAKWSGEIVNNLREDSAREVHRLVWKPLAPKLPTAQDAKLYIAPDGQLARLPWGALPGQRRQVSPGRLPPGVGSQRHILDGCLVAPGSRRFASEPVPHDGKFLLVADVAYSEKPALVFPLGPQRLDLLAKVADDVNRLPDLGGTALEADWIKPLVTKLPGAPRLEERRRAKASVAQLLRDLPGAQIAHIATHGVFASNSTEKESRYFRPEDFAMAPNGMRLGAAARSPLAQVALALAGAKLGPESQAGVCLFSGELFAGQDLGQLRLFVLPACYSAKGEEVNAEGVYGLQRALHQAGVDDVVAALWKVADDTAPSLMLLFYHNLISGKPPIDALREAQLFLLRNPEAARSLLERHAPRDVAKLIADRSRGDDPDFVALQSSPRRQALTKGSPPIRASTKDWGVFVLSGIGE